MEQRLFAAGPQVDAGKRSRFAAISAGNSLMQNGPKVSPASIVFNLFDDAQLTGILEHVSTPGEGRTILRGHLMDIADSYFLLACESNVIAGTILAPGKGAYRIQYAGEGLHQIIEVDTTNIPRCAAEDVTRQTSLSSAPQARETPQALTDGKTLTVVDVIVLYTDAARDGAGGGLGISTWIDLAVAEANLAYENSKVNLFLHLAQKAKVPYHESGDVRLDFSRMMNTSDGYLDDIASRRLAASADLVCLLVENSQEIAGVAMLTANATNGFSVVQRHYAVGQQVFAHELAHNFGCQHDQANASAPGVYSYSYGWHFDADFTTYGTVMSYVGWRIPYFSNPSVTYHGVPTGNSGANNAQTLALRMQTVSAFSGIASTTQTPTVDFISPTNNSSVFVGGEVLLTASATTNGGLSRIEFYQDGILIGSGAGPSSTCLVTNLAYGDFAFTAKAINLLGAATLSTPAVTVHARYRNDQFAGRQTFTGTNAVVAFCNLGATLESGETPASEVGAATVWFTWQAPVAGRVLFTMPGHSFAGFAAVYTGNTLTNLHLVTSMDFNTPVWFDVEQDISYQIVVGGYNNSTTEGCGTLTWEEHARTANDNLSNAISIPGAIFHATANNVGATAEPGEPSHYYGAQGHSVWWRWTAPTNGELRISATGLSVALAAYIGSSVSNLTRVTPSAGSLQCNVVSGTTYFVAADNFAGNYIDFDLDLNFTPAPSRPPNDDFADRIWLTGSNITFVGTTTGATREFGEPGDPGNSSGPGRSVWWSWTAPSACQLSLRAETNAAIFEIFTSASLTNLTKLGDAAVNATVGTTYHFRLDTAEQPFTTVIHLDTVPRITGLSNDDFAGRTILAGSRTAVIESNNGATKEAGEPNHGNNPGGQSVWFSWTATYDGRVRFRVDGGWQLFYPLLGVYRGTTLNSLQSLGQSAFASPYFTPPEVILPVTNGTTVQIAIDGYNGFFGMGSVGEFQLSITGPPTNDNFTAAQPLDGTNLTVKSSNYLGSKEPGEPNHGFSPGGSSAWFSWTPPANGSLRLSVNCTFGRLVGIYTGSALSNLQPVFSTANPALDLDIAGGRTYYIAIDDSAGLGGDFILNLAFTPSVVRPVNDNFANRTTVNTLGEIRAGNTNATREYGEPNHAGLDGSKSVWWELTSPVTGRVNLDPSGGNISVAVVYSGTQLTNLLALASSPIVPGGAVEFDAVVGQKYQIAVDAFDRYGDPGYGSIDLRFSVQLAPPNDNFANRYSLSGTSVVVPVSTVGASRENGEPTHAASGHHSVWYSWSAPATGTVFVRTFASNLSTLIAAYRGSQLTNLVKLMESIGGYNATGQFAVSAGETYQIAADTFDNQFGDFSLSLEFWPTPINDLFALRLPLSGNFIHLSASNIGATREPGEIGDYFPGASIPGTNSVWWTWTATATGTLTVSGSSDFSALLSLYTGSAVDALQAIPRTIDWWTGQTIFDVQAGTTYQVSLDGYIEGGNGTVGTVEYNLWASGPPPNDNFANRQTIPGMTNLAYGFNVYATPEINEPDPHGATAGKSVWYSWVAPEAGRYVVSAESSDFGEQSLIAVYTGNALTNLSLVAQAGPPGSTSFKAQAGVAYAVSVDTVNTQSVGLVRLVVRLAPVNDAFEDRISFSGTNAFFIATNSGATTEPGELIQGNGRTLWWSWTAPVTGWVTITPENYDIRAQVFQGATISNLVVLASGSWAFGFTAVAGRTYQISMDSVYGLSVLSFSLTEAPAPSNDNFAAATAIAGLSVLTNGNNTGATVEPDEARFPDTNSSATIWWKWTAPQSRQMTIHASAGFDTCFAAFTGSSVSNLALVSLGTNAGSFTAAAGSTYYIAADGRAGALGNIDLRLTPTPTNDLFSSRRSLSGYSISLRDSNDGALMEPGEMNHAVDPSGASVWFTWTAPASGAVTITYEGDVFWPAIGVYTGTALNNLAGVAGNNFNHPVTFTATAGVTYQIALAGYYGGEGNYRFNLWLNAGKANDLFAQRIALSGTNLTVAANNADATIESGEPNPSGFPASHSLWWSWTAPDDGSVSLNFSGTSFTPVLGIYTGNTLPALKAVTNVPDYFDPQIFFHVAGGSNYLISFDGYNGAAGDIQFQLEFRSAPANDYFANRLVLSTDSFVIHADNRGATTEAGEPQHAGVAGSHSLWWSWTAPGSDAVTLKVAGERYTPRMAVYRGSTLATLEIVSSNCVTGVLRDTVTFTAEQGTNYQIALDSAFTESGPLSLTMIYGPKPPNDDFLNAPVVDARAASVTGSNSGATAEVGEPAHAGYPANHSIWWKWTASVSGPVSADTLGSSFDTVLAVYTGAKLTNLTAVAWNDDAPSAGGASQVVFNTAAGVTYFLAVDGFASSIGDVQLNLIGTAPDPIRFTGIAPLLDGRLALSLSGTSTELFVLETSTNLVDWQTVLTNQFSGSTHEVLQPVNSNAPMRFYRARSWP